MGFAHNRNKAACRAKNRIGWPPKDFRKKFVFILLLFSRPHFICVSGQMRAEILGGANHGKDSTAQHSTAQHSTAQHKYTQNLRKISFIMATISTF
jgi:hypothetical protein